MSKWESRRAGPDGPVGCVLVYVVAYTGLRAGELAGLQRRDVDHFKQLNDGLGHEAGDEALRRVATVLSESKRRIDTAVRMGGEEFALVVPDTDQHDAYILAERIRTRLRDAFADEPLPITISFGIAVFPQDGGMLDEVLRAADRALYAAKRLGRDRTVRYSPDLSSSLAEGEFVTTPYPH